MQRYYEVVRDGFGNLASGVSALVYLTGTTTKAGLFADTDAADLATTSIANPIITTANGLVAFAAADGDYDLVISGSNLPATIYRYKVNLLDGTTISAAPFSQVSLVMPPEFTVAGSPAGASGIITVSRATEVKNLFWAGPATGADAAPTFRAITAADANTVLMDLSTNQLAGGNKSFSGTFAVSGAATFSAAVTNNNTLTQTGASTFASTISMAADQDFLIAGSQGWSEKDILLDMSRGTTSGTICTTAVLGAGGYNVYNFADAATNSICGYIRLPNDYAAGTDIYPFLNWTTVGTEANNVKWGIEYTVITGNNTGVFPAPATLSVLTAAGGATNKLMYSEFSAITGTTFLPNTCLVCRIFRDGTHGTDNNTEAALLISAGISYKSSRFATKNRIPSFYV